MMTTLELSENTTIGELVQSGLYGDFARFIFTYMTPDHWNNPLRVYGFETVGFEKTLRRMRELSGKNQVMHFHIWPKEDRLAQWDKDTVWLEFFPAPVSGQRKPYALILPGGGFNRQWGMIEGQAIAARLNELGMPAFVLYYRVKQEPVVQLAIEDLYAAVRFIDRNAGRFGVEAGEYLLGGFSAGASVAGCLLTERFSAQSGGIPAPKTVMLGYAPARYDEFYRTWKEAPEGSAERESGAAVLRRVGGPCFTPESLAPYNIPMNLSPEGPAVYLTANEDDPVVPAVNTHALEEALKERGRTVRSRIGKTGGHSYGLGIGLEAEGWLDEAAELFESVIKRDRRPGE